MPFITSVSKIDLPYRMPQQEAKEHARALFAKSVPQIDRLIQAYDNTGIVTRNFCAPVGYYLSHNTFEDRNQQYRQTALAWSVKAIEDCIAKENIDKLEITDIIFISTTGLATPSLDALIINQMRLNPHINRIPVFGLGCSGGVSGIAVELCSLTMLMDDFSKSNFIGSSLFSDGIAACIIRGGNHLADERVTLLASGSKLYYDSLEVMGWDFRNTGFKVLFSKDIPTIITAHVREDIEHFLTIHGLGLNDIKNFIFHPGGKKVLDAYAEALGVDGDFLQNTRLVMNNYGNMSSVTVLYVLEKFMNEGFEDGYGLMLAMGPGFSSEMVLLKMKN
jgi:alkylresorcinol/alkylpyrone synthase